MSLNPVTEAVEIGLMMGPIKNVIVDPASIKFVDSSVGSSSVLVMGFYSITIS